MHFETLPPEGMEDRATARIFSLGEHFFVGGAAKGEKAKPPVSELYYPDVSGDCIY